MADQKPIRIEISYRTILFTLATLGLIYLLFKITDILVLIYLAFMLSVAINPLVNYLHRRKLPKNLAIGLSYVLILAILVGLIVAIVPPLVTETARLISQIPIPPTLAEDIKHLNLDVATLNALATQLNSIPKVLNVIGSTVSFFTVLVTMIIMSFYILKSRPDLPRNIMWLFGRNQTERQAAKFVDRIDQQIGGWVRGEFFLMMAVGFMTYLGLLLLNVSFAVPLALFAGLMEIIPGIGPTVSAIPAIIIAILTASPTMAVAVTALYVLVQQLENYFLVPYVMKRAVDINPLTTLIIILIGYRLGGFGGAALAIPLFLTIKVVFKEYLRLRPKV